MKMKTIAALLSMLPLTPGILARGMVSMGGIPARGAGPGDVLASGEVINVLNADSAQTLTGPQIAGGILNRTGMTAGRVDTTPTAHDTLIAIGGNDYAANVLPGTAFRFFYRQAAAFATTWAHGRGWIAGVGVLDVAASTIKEFLVRVLNSTPEVVLVGGTTIGTPDVVLAVPQLPGVITPGMLVSAAAGITAGTRVAGVHYGSTANRDNTDRIVRITLDQNAITATDPAKSLTFSPVLELNGLGAKAI